MFTGLIKTLGQVEACHLDSGDGIIEVVAENKILEALNIGDSIAVNGVCLTVTVVGENGFHVDVSRETLSCTNLGELIQGLPVNLEPTLTLADLLGGHLVSGHIDGIAHVSSMWQDGSSWRVTFTAPSQLMRYIAPKGSVCLDGVSLTVNEVAEQSFGVNIIPHTWNNTLFQYYKVGSVINLEVDLLARYVERLLSQSS